MPASALPIRLPVDRPPRPTRTSWSGRLGDRRHRWAATAARVGVGQFVHLGLHRLWSRGALPPGPVVLAVDLHTWWEAVVVLTVLHRQGRRGALVVAAGDRRPTALLCRVGALPTGRLSPARMTPGEVLVVLPERGRDDGPGPMPAGLPWLAARTSATLAVAAVRVVRRGHRRPDCHVELRACPPGAVLSPDLLSGTLRDLDRQLREATTGP